MFTLVIGAVVLTVFYGVLWHNQPASERRRKRLDGRREKAPDENPRQVEHGLRGVP
jgi:hypothetical protein